MLHGPCQPTSYCMLKQNSCMYNYPKNFQDYTTQNNDGYPLYRRRDDGKFVLKQGIKMTNQWVVPHNLYLTNKYNAHINVEICSTISAVKYLYKYVYKGHDKIVHSIQTEEQQIKSENI